MLLILSQQQLRSLLLSSPQADKTSEERRGFFKEISSVFSFPPWHPIGTSAAASGDEAWTCLFGAKEGYLRCTKALSRDLLPWRRTGRKELMSGWRREGVTVQEKERRGDEKDRTYGRKARWEKHRSEGGEEREKVAWGKMYILLWPVSTPACRGWHLNHYLLSHDQTEHLNLLRKSVRDSFQGHELAVSYLRPCWITCAVKHVLKVTSGEANKALHAAKERQGEACEELSIVLFYYPCLNWQSYFCETRSNVCHV